MAPSLMEVLGKIDDYRGKNNHTLCSVGKIIVKLDPKERAKLDTILANEAFTSPQITRALADAGHRVNSDTLARHRRGGCMCKRDRA